MIPLQERAHFVEDFGADHYKLNAVLQKAHALPIGDGGKLFGGQSHWFTISHCIIPAALVGFKRILTSRRWQRVHVSNLRFEIGKDTPQG